MKLDVGYEGRGGCYNFLQREHLGTNSIPFLCSTFWLRQAFLATNHVKHLTLVEIMLFQMGFHWKVKTLEMIIDVSLYILLLRRSHLCDVSNIFCQVQV